MDIPVYIITENQKKYKLFLKKRTCVFDITQERGKRDIKMDIKTDRKYLTKVIILSLVSAAAGFLNGMLGAGGGILFIFILSRLNSSNDGELDSSSKARDDFAMTIAAILPISAVSAFMYMSKGSFSFDEIPVYIVPAIAGGISGAFLLDRIKVSFLKKIFAVLVIYSGISMLTR